MQTISVEKHKQVDSTVDNLLAGKCHPLMSIEVDDTQIVGNSWEDVLNKLIERQIKVVKFHSMNQLG